MHTQYFHANTVDISREFVSLEYGTIEDIPLDQKSSQVKLFFPIRSKNIEASLTIPKGAELHLTETGTLFSLDNLIASDNERYVFRTKYFNLADYIDKSGQFDLSGVTNVSPVPKRYNREEICCVPESNRIGDIKTLSSRYKRLLQQVIGKESISTLLDIGYILEFVDKRINEWEDGPWKTGIQIIDELETKGFYEGNCTEREALTRWLLSVGNVSNRTIMGQIASESGMFNGEYYPERKNMLHAWNEIQISDGKKNYWTPLDSGNMPYLREDSLLVHYVPASLPEVITKNKSKFAECTLLMNQV